MKELNIMEMNLNPMKMIGKQWLALTAGNEKHGYNTMCISWGMMGSMWRDKDPLNQFATVTVFVRPSRYTKEFIDKEEYFTLSLFKEKDKDKLMYLGTHSGRDEDKIAKVGLTPVFEQGTTFFDEAETVFICRKLYKAPIEELNFMDKNIVENCYPNRDFGELYFAQIVKVLGREE